MNSSEIVVALRARSSGTDFYRAEEFGKAFANYLLALNINRQWHEELKEVFIHCLCEWGHLLEQEGRISDLFTCYEEALKLYPNSEVILNGLGSHLLRLNHAKDAYKYFCKSLKINPLHLPAYRNVENVSNLLVERWHFRMLNDQNRNECYQRALHAEIQPDDDVLDIGMGTGLLSVYASEKGPRSVYGCDYSSVMTSIATNIIEKNGLQDKVAVINKMSNDLKIPQDIPQKLSLIVTETMDAGLLGEGLLQTLHDAWNRLLVNNASSLSCIKPRVIPHKAIIYGAPVESLYLAKQYKYLPPKQNNYFKFDFNIYSYSNDPYDSENLKEINYKFLADTVTLFSINLNDPSCIQEYLEGKINIETLLTCNNEGYLDAFIVWFDLYLTETEIISTSPLSNVESCWEQAVFPVCRKMKVDKGTKIKIRMNTTGGKLSLINLNLINHDVSEDKRLCVSKAFIKFINCESVLTKLDHLMNEVNKKCVTISDVLDLSICPLISLNILRERQTKIVSFLRNYQDKEFLKYYTVVNNCESSCKLYAWDELEEILKTKKNYDIIIVDLLNAQGELNDSLINIYPTLRRCLKDNGFIFPTYVKVNCRLIHSEWLDKNSRLNNKYLLEEYKGFDIINNFKVNHFIDLDINKLQYVNMSETLEVATLPLDDIFREGLKEFAVNTRALHSGSINAALYWFTYGSETVEISSETEDFYRNQCAQIIHQTLLVEQADSLNVKLNYMSCIIKFDVSVVR